ncbi:MAG: hypothetical protein A3J51_02165 [Omnitrophica WOR_2 bacterium RIFCSPHIGHO2_02_FULL_45_21]|nr:MAG: hypothetical protein A3J51_02165 [Omnitrophica WOR_2 bacterium RIFCSPHIGHO2_02_FULL_45_21]
MRIYCPPENITQNKITIFDHAQLHHLVDVMRRRVGDRLSIFDGQSLEYECVIDKITKDMAELTINSLKKISQEKGLRVILACAIPKKAKIDFIIEKATELGVERIIPLQTERAIVRIYPDRARGKLRRWQMIAKEAAKQCGRITLPLIEPVTPFIDALTELKEYDLAIIPNLGVGNQDIEKVMSNFKGKSVIVFIGPEGDFSECEIELAKASGCKGVSLGNLTLKVDTAAIAVVAFLRLSACAEGG